jgi:hypothetical protein
VAFTAFVVSYRTEVAGEDGTVLESQDPAAEGTEVKYVHNDTGYPSFARADTGQFSRRRMSANPPTEISERFDDLFDKYWDNPTKDLEDDLAKGPGGTAKDGDSSVVGKAAPGVQKKTVEVINELKPVSSDDLPKPDAKHPPVVATVDGKNYEIAKVIKVEKSLPGVTPAASEPAESDSPVSPACEKCVHEFKANGGCELWSSGKNPEEALPDHCDKTCTLQAAVACQGQLQGLTVQGAVAAGSTVLQSHSGSDAAAAALAKAEAAAHKKVAQAQASSEAASKGSDEAAAAIAKAEAAAHSKVAQAKAASDERPPISDTPPTLGRKDSKFGTRVIEAHAYDRPLEASHMHGSIQVSDGKIVLPPLVGEKPPPLLPEPTVTSVPAESHTDMPPPVDTTVDEDTEEPTPSPAPPTAEPEDEVFGLEPNKIPKSGAWTGGNSNWIVASPWEQEKQDAPFGGGEVAKVAPATAKVAAPATAKVAAPATAKVAKVARAAVAPAPVAPASEESPVASLEQLPEDSNAKLPPWAGPAEAAPWDVPKSGGPEAALLQMAARSCAARKVQQQRACEVKKQAAQAHCQKAGAVACKAATDAADAHCTSTAKATFQACFADWQTAKAGKSP